MMPVTDAPAAACDEAPLRLRELFFGSEALGAGLRDCWRAIAGDGELPPTRFGPSSLKIFKPWLSLPTWLGRRPRSGLIPVYNLPNRKAPAPGQPYSVRVTDCEDFQGGRWTYDGHVGTDFAIPAGTPIAAPAPARVLAVRTDMNRGGLKVILDHGAGRFSSHNHLARALVHPGQVLRRGELIGLSGMSSVDGLLFFPWLAPHLHLTVFVAGAAQDPFARPAEASLWRRRNEPAPAAPEDEELPATSWDEAAIAEALASCRSPSLVAKVRALPDLAAQAAELFYALNFLSPLFEAWPCLVAEPAPRAPFLDLPFRPSEARGLALPSV